MAGREEEGSDRGRGKDVQEGKNGVQEADFFVGDETECESHKDKSPGQTMEYPVTGD